MQKVILIGAIAAVALVLTGYNLGVKTSDFSGIFGVDSEKDISLENLGQGSGAQTAPNKRAVDSAQKTETNPEIPKNEKPSAELFVMSYCPFGTQAQKGILPVVETLGDKINFQLKFVDYIMHEKREIDENSRQYCVQKTAPAKLAGYLRCFLKKGEGTESACLSEAGVSAASVSACMAQADKDFKISEMYADKSTWQGGRFPQYNVDKDANEKYGVSGSPSLVINQTKINSARDPQSLLDTICSAFENPPLECQTELSSANPSPGFGEGSGSAGSASCGS